LCADVASPSRSSNPSLPHIRSRDSCARIGRRPERSGSPNSQRIEARRADIAEGAKAHPLHRQPSRIQDTRLVSAHRGATWVDEASQIVWLCAARRREEGSDGDAYTWFAEPHGRGHLLPAADDALRDRAEAAIRRQRELRRDLLALLNKALAAPGEEQGRDLGGWAPCRALVIRGEGAEEIWCALSTRAVDGAFIQPQVRDLLFAALEAHVGAALFEVRTDWPTGPLDWAEIVKLGIRYD